MPTPPADDTPLTLDELLTRAGRLVDSIEADHRRIATAENDLRWSLGELAGVLVEIERGLRAKPTIGPVRPTFSKGDRVRINCPDGLNGGHDKAATVTGPAYDGDGRYLTVEFEDGTALCWPIAELEPIDRSPVAEDPELLKRIFQPPPDTDAPIDSSTQPDAEIERHVANVFAGLNRRPVVGDIGCEARRPILHRAAQREVDVFDDSRDAYGNPSGLRKDGDDGFVA